jgi:hypothetical protein
MASSQNDIPNDQPVPRNIRNSADTYEDEIDLIDYFRVLWKRKYFIVLGSALPALLVGLILFLSPRDYKVTHTYDTGLDEQGGRVLLGQFYGAENVDKLAGKLRESGFDRYAQQMSKANIQLEISDASLTMTITGSPAKDVQRISSIVRDNLEKVIPIYSVKKELGVAIAGFKSKMADIKDNEFSLELELERNKAILPKLKDLASSGLGEIPGNIVLHFDNVSANSAYLPLAYQAQATDAKIINLEETVRANLRTCDYYKSLLSLNERLLDEVTNKASSYYTIQEFHAFMTNILGEYEDKESADYLNAYIKRTENVMSANSPVIEEPSVYPVPKGTVKKSEVVFAALLMITMFAAFLIEAVQKKRIPAS